MGLFLVLKLRAWYQAPSDPLIGKALRLLREDPARRWTVAEPAARVGISRAAFAARLSALVGELTLTFLTGWRIALAADLLQDAETTVAAVAREVGYEDPFAFSVAFKRTPSGSLRPRERAPSRQPDGQ
ncbi:helix-turn-helix transcriptional regulator [Streptomyces sp. NPDC001709]